MSALYTSIPTRFISNLFTTSGKPAWWAIGLVISVAILQSSLVFLGSFFDGTLTLPNEGDGVLEHYGVWTILITDPLLVIAAGFAYRRFLIALGTLPITPNKGKKLQMERVLVPYLKFLEMDGNSKYLYFLIVAFGALCWINNIRQTIDPEPTYGNDVFDSAQYVWGFIANKMNLFSSWVVVYPLVGFELVVMSISIRLILIKITDDDIVAPNVLHPDGCYGMLNLGYLNVSLIFPYFLSYCVVFALLITHENQYFSVIAAMIGLSIVMVSVSFLTIGPIAKLGGKIRDETYQRLQKTNKRYNGNNRNPRTRFALELICYLNARPTPYSKWAQTSINFFRIAPAALTAYKLFV